MPLFHAFDPGDWMFAHNMYVGQGRITAISMARHFQPEWAGIMSPYEMFTREREKEEVFESVRADQFQDCPPRLGSIFLFATRESADACNAEWWQGNRVILEAEILDAVGTGTFDSQQLNAPKNQWKDAADRYWSQEFTAQPRIEVVVCGRVQLIGWERYARLMRP